ncbi:hypothetical protein PILCRDRAFT_817261 [Piloderma croceum F 1598]|uniref:Uncharacterized protein n=1 Tax=Piloderma croceum (strain F 1598) TaxID=765440 RepID=A0A0C3C6I5_PILCF|nr:hypothetical protein PILCRDRAFT_817261 [Piloderma croceum F 1598]
MNSYDQSGCAFSQVPHEYEVQTVQYTSSSPEDNSSLYPPGYYDNSASSSVTSFDEDTFNSHLGVHEELTLRYPEPQVWPSQAPVYDPPSLGPLQISVPDAIYAPDMPLHAPVPRPHRMSSDPYLATHHATSLARQVTPQAHHNTDGQNTPKTNFPQQPSLLDDYPQLMFPTPSELLHDLAAHDDAVAQNREENDPETRHESQRKARQRALAESIGFTPTDPDTISSHEKKRHYLECLEHYIMYLHDQLRLVGTEPVMLERVSTYRGLSSRSIRTLLVHMENNVRKLHQQTLAEEQVFLDLRSQVMAIQEAQDATTAAQEFRRHSVAACMGVSNNSSVSYIQ